MPVDSSAPWIAGTLVAIAIGPCSDESQWAAMSSRIAVQLVVIESAWPVLACLAPLDTRFVWGETHALVDSEAASAAFELKY